MLLYSEFVLFFSNIIKMQEINYRELKAWQAAGKEFQLIDVREVEEHEAFNIGGELMPLDFFLRNTERIDPTKPVVVYCKRGIRSQLAIQRISKKRTDIEFYNLQGGILHLI